uniref:Histone-lysine N-methyltransferase SETD7 n=1 Tax=Chelonoidis abingdonii TaxID=106734 RepID=A0A8C0G7Z5_CHEAB
MCTDAVEERGDTPGATIAAFTCFCNDSKMVTELFWLLDDDGLPHGFCTVTYSSTDRFEGNFVHGEKNGRGKFFFFDGSTLEGYYVDDALQGQGLYTYEDGGVLHGTHVDGELNGPAQEYDIDGRLIFKGQYKDNIRHGVCWIYYPVSLAHSLGFWYSTLPTSPVFLMGFFHPHCPLFSLPKSLPFL